MNEVRPAFAGPGLFEIGADGGRRAQILLAQNPPGPVLSSLQRTKEFDRAQGVSCRPFANLLRLVDSALHGAPPRILK